MSKPLFIISCPIDTYSGYGARSRDLVKSIINLDKYHVKILPQRWGNTPWNFIKNNPEWLFLEPHILNTNQLPQQPDIWAQITVPNEFQSVGKYNIGFTAGIETTICDPSWIEGVNRMDVTFVSSNHAKKVFETSQFESKNPQTQQVEKIIKLEKPVEVLFEGANLDIYKPTTEPCLIDFDIPESFAYLFVGHWMHGELGEDRKNVGLLVKAFLEVFKNKKTKPALILKTSQVNSSYMDRDELLNKINQIKNTVNSTDLPNIYLLHGEFSDEEMNSLYNHSKVKAMISLTKGEGFGRPLLEFTLSRKPIIATNWSGHIDFLHPDHSILLGGTLTNVHPSAASKNMILTESQWFSVNHSHVGTALKDVFENYKKYVDAGKRQAYYSKTNFSFKKMEELLDQLLTQYLPEFPKQVTLQLPKLDKISLPKKPE